MYGIALCSLLRGFVRTRTLHKLRLILELDLFPPHSLVNLPQGVTDFQARATFHLAQTAADSSFSALARVLETTTGLGPGIPCSGDQSETLLCQSGSVGTLH